MWQFKMLLEQGGDAPAIFKLQTIRDVPGASLSFVHLRDG